MDYRQEVKDKKKIVIKIGTSTITYPETGNINLDKLEKFVRILINLRNKGKEVIVVSSGAVGTVSYTHLVPWITFSRSCSMMPRTEKRGKSMAFGFSRY